MNTPKKRRLLRKWGKQRLALQSKIEQVLEKRSEDEVAIRKFTINWQNTGLNIFSTKNLDDAQNRRRRQITAATRKCQPEITELAKIVDREIKQLGFIDSQEIPAKLPQCSVDANRALAGMRN
jgi:DNA-binding transcriptional MerR regulator|tara:strand:- start:2719 stop:3087 length:369 start_codon:yes stop_codon:yes gene_type:complete